MCSKVKAKNFTTLVYSVLVNVGKRALKMMKPLWKNCLITAKDVGIIHVNFIVITTTFFWKKMEALLSYHLS
jgi:hypothetical protein